MTIEEMNYPVAGNIERLIQERGLKKNFVAEKSNLAPMTLSDMLNGRRLIRINEIPALAAAIGVEPNSLFEVQGDVE